MGFILNEKTFVNDNIFKYEQRLGSQYSIFTDRNPTFVTYYHINNVNSITDTGLLNVDRILGKESPLKYQRVQDFPIYGIDQIKLDLSDDEEGLTSSYDGEAIILPNTIKPLPNDFFTVSYLDESYLFMVTTIDYDTIKSNNYYKIGYTLKTISTDSLNSLNDQVLEKYTCIFKNIGTEDNCLLREDEFETLNGLNVIYETIVSRYIALFYNKRYNSFLYNALSSTIYDKFVTNFISAHGLLNKAEKYDTICVNNEDYGEQFPITYEMSFYGRIEDRDIPALDYIRYELCPITYQQSIFLYYNVKNIRSLTFVPDHVGSGIYVNDSLIDAIRDNTPETTDTIIEELIVKYFNDSIDSIFQINLDKIKDYRMKYTMSDYVMIPMLLYIIKHYITQFLHM